MTRRRLLHGWLALLAVLFATLAPSISHALAASSSARSASPPSLILLDICTVDGLKSADAGSLEHQSGMDPVAHAFEHCPYCHTHGGSFALLPSAHQPLAVPGAHAIFPRLFLRAPRTLFVWSSANPRGPPRTA
ncbi:DUF2946 domain-containing protein [Janthinobacterium aquaticum]|uniref:DUF2946 domain-containing protein n=1 Tax=Janthinobacterium sp. FT58W TaxID=2654254 RepID=UPI001D00CD55|nr:DUF2946 domain-containing protein [Janthinobacterium sp. FT58W]